MHLTHNSLIKHIPTCLFPTKIADSCAKNSSGNNIVQKGEYNTGCYIFVLHTRKWSHCYSKKSHTFIFEKYLQYSIEKARMSPRKTRTFNQWQSMHKAKSNGKRDREFFFPACQLERARVLGFLAKHLAALKGNWMEYCSRYRIDFLLIVSTFTKSVVQQEIKYQYQIWFFNGMGGNYERHIGHL